MLHIYSDDTVELRHGGGPEVTDNRFVYGDEIRGRIEWDSGRISGYEWNGAQYVIDGAKASEIDSCL